MKTLVVVGLGLSAVACRGIVEHDEPTGAGIGGGAPNVGGNGASEAAASGGSAGGSAGGGSGAGVGGAAGAAGADGGTDAGCVSSSECEVLSGPCVTGVCIDGNCQAQNAPAGTPCGSGASASFCDGTGVCVAVSCTDSVKNGDESDVDCGGSCSACGNGLSCGSTADCASGLCDPSTGKCAPCGSNDDCLLPATPLCDAGICSPQKPNGVACSGSAECLSGHCVDAVCCAQPSCGSSGCFICNKSGFEGTCHEAPSGTACAGGKCDGAGVCTSGACLWTKSPSTAGGGFAYSIAFDATGNTLITGEFEGTLDFGCGPVSSAKLPGQSGTTDVFVAKLDPTGSCLWSKASGDTNTQVGRAVDFDALGNAVVAGRFQTSIDLGCGSMASIGTMDAFVAKLSAGGACIWSKSAGTGGVDAANGVATDTAGNLLLTGNFNESLDFGCSETLWNNSGGLFVAKFDPTGLCTWLRGAGSANGWAIDTDAADNVFVGGYFTGGNAGLGCGPLSNLGDWDGLVAKLDSSGNCVWSKAVASYNQDLVTDLAVDQLGNVYIAGYSSGTLDAGCGPMAAGGSNDPFIAKLDGQGTCVWSKKAGDFHSQIGFGIAVDGSANVVMVGTTGGTLDLGCGPIGSPTVSGAFVAKFDTAGTCLWSKVTDSHGTGFGVTADDSGNVALCGEFNGSLDLGCGPSANKVVNRPFIAKLSP